MKRIFFAAVLFAACVAFVSCKKGCTGEPDPQPGQWRVARIGWMLDGDNAVDYFDEAIEKDPVVNDSAEEKSLTIEWLEGMSGTSTFECGDSGMFAEAAAAAAETIVPSEESLLSAEEWRYMASGMTAPLRLDGSDLPFATSMSDKYTLAPMSRYEFGGTVTLKRLNARFRIEMEEENTREVRYVEGSWTGTFFHSISVEVYVSDIE